MPESRLRTRSVSEIVDAAFQLYRQDAPQYIAVTAVAYAPWLIFQLLFMPGHGVTSPSIGEAASSAAIYLVGALGTWVVFALMSAVVVQLGSDAYLGAPGTRDIGDTIRRVLPRVPAIMIAGLIKGVLVMVGALAFLVGAFYVASMLFAVSTSIVLEGQGAWSSLGRSAALSKGRKWHILLTLLLVFVIYFILSMAIAFIGGMSGSTVVMLVLTTAYTIVAYPVVGLTEMVLYYDARIRGEGFDIEVMAQGLGSAAAEG